MATTATAAPVATSQPQYEAYGAVFPDPLAVCQQNCDPNARGRVNATSFIEYQDFVNGVTFMNQNEDWKRYMEVLPLDGKKGDGAGTEAGEEMWPGNNLAKLEWDPKPEYQSVGLATTNQEQGTGKLTSDLIVVRVTDENVPDENKKRYALSLSIHGIERAGAEGGIRAMEEIVTAVSEDRGDENILPEEVRSGSVTWREVLANTIIYFTLPNPDGWRRGSLSDGGTYFQRYNGNGVDLNRDWPDIGYQFRPYSGASEPETRAFRSFYRNVQEKGGPFAAGDDLHGMPFADALSYTLLPHGKHSFDKDFRIREAAKVINRAQYEATKWSPYIIDNDAGPATCEGTDLGDACTAIYAQTWGSVYDTINYTTTGSLGDWFDSSLGLNADGIDNEMAFSHVDRNVAFEPHGEQLHVSGNKAIIYSHIDDLLRPPSSQYSTEGKNGYVQNARLTRERQELKKGAPEGTVPQEDVSDEPPTGGDPGPPPTSVYEFEVERDAKTFNGGMRIDVRATNVQGIGSGSATLKIQCQGCDDHIGQAEGDWVTVTEDYNQSPLYAQAGLTAAVNSPQPGPWRAVVSAPGGVPRFSVDYSSDLATTDGGTAGDPPPFLAAYDVANTDFFPDLSRDAKADDDKFSAVDPAKVISGEQPLDGFDTLVLADDPLPGYVGELKGEVRPTGPPTADFDIAHDPATPTTPGQTSPEGCQNSPTALEHRPFEIGANDGNSEMEIAISWSLDTSDYDLYLAPDTNGNGTWDGAEAEPLVTSSADFLTTSETITVPRPAAGKYVIVVGNCSAPSEADPWSGTVRFKGFPDPGAGRFTPADKDSWFAKLSAWVAGGGNLVLTDSSLRALPELTSVPGSAIERQTVYLGQTSFLACTELAEDGSCAESKETTSDPLARNVVQQGARFNSGMRRQTYEPTPLGFAIQNEGGADASFSPQWDVDQQAFEAAGGRHAGGSATGDPDAATAVPERTTLGELPVGSGTVRIAGALLPQPSNQYDHQLGIEPYALTYTGYILLCNLIDCQYERRERPAPDELPNPPAPPGPVELGFDVGLDAELLASTNTRRGKRVPLRINTVGTEAIERLVLQYRRTGRGAKKNYTNWRPRLRPRTKRVTFGRGKLGQTYLFRIRAVGKTGADSGWRYRRVVFPYDDRGKGRSYSKGWKRLKAKRAWRGAYSRTSRRGATMIFTTKGGGRVYLIARTTRKGGRAVVQAAGGKKQVVSFRSKKPAFRRVVAIANRTDKRNLRFRLRVLRGTVTVDGIGVRRR